MKTAELIGPALDWAVELANGIHWSNNGYFVFKNADGSTRTFERNPEWHYSTNWSQGGPIIEREKIALKENGYGHWFAKVPGGKWVGSSTPLIAAMRCYVASKLGDEVDIPKELQ
ncbi:phage protein NinX family protein [Ferribacterium limneticum]|uniref:phage protein NinX family protein n=1 Tax=Ferribacterium limneticum TaxID=76259 RepID=UPI001CF917AE|nr:phage protein NinX family protein [Ferribacterium limneticum]UCV26754.1 DUF2591 family protein [Ferribacterium limneticum]UCV30671.1 DUF2591 family protein [Ferribacterium limneticum]